MLTPQEVSTHSFSKASFGGYNMAMVDEFLDELTDDYTALYKENAALKAKLKVLVEKVEEYRATGEKTGVLENPQYRDVIADDGKKDAFSAVLSQRVGCKIADKRGHRQQSAAPQSR